MLMKSHGIHLRIGKDLVTIRIPTLYKLELGLPTAISLEKHSAYFDCKLRKLFVTLKIEKFQVAPSEVEQLEKPVSVVEVVDTKNLESDLLFDVV